MLKLGEKIRKIRIEKGFSQEYVAEKLGISSPAFSNIERDKTQLTWDRIEDISKILNVDPFELVKNEPVMIFKDCNQSGNIQTINNYPSNDERINLLEQKIKELESQVSVLSKI
jgi:transcriptional regulator with XRE-family HTH domain